MRAIEGAPKFEESQRLPDVCYEGFARSLGLNGVAVDQPGQVGPAWGQTDLSIPPIPPHATFEQAKDAALALLKGDQDRWAVLKEGVMTKPRDPARQERFTETADAS